MGNDTHRSSARLRAKRLCPQPPPQRTPPRTPPRQTRLHEEERRVGACTHGTSLCSPPRPRTDRAPSSIAQTSTTRRGRRGRPARIRPPPPADTIPRGLLERRPRHTRTLVLVFPRAPAQAYSTACSPSTMTSAYRRRLHVHTQEGRPLPPPPRTFPRRS
ncbi:hypothetical protein B0H14DRAFT_2802370 [Mycena olivaceomarginata]|nr:hypothetical protein B0H14DRAFT_2802370 [Mycena olivaceomarginata]